VRGQPKTPIVASIVYELDRLDFCPRGLRVSNSIHNFCFATVLLFVSPRITPFIPNIEISLREKKRLSENEGSVCFPNAHLP
jgi:hypothetical protein